ncbi:hypothetical protein D3C83_330130 [compost metagenome]
MPSFFKSRSAVRASGTVIAGTSWRATQRGSSSKRSLATSSRIAGRYHSEW